MKDKNAKHFWSRYNEFVSQDLQIARETGIAKSTLSTWKQKGIFPRADAAYRIAQVLNTTVEYLVTGNADVSLFCSPKNREILMILDRLSDEGKDVAKSIIAPLLDKYSNE